MNACIFVGKFLETKNSKNGFKILFIEETRQENFEPQEVQFYVPPLRVPLLEDLEFGDIISIQGRYKKSKGFYLTNLDKICDSNGYVKVKDYGFE